MTTPYHRRLLVAGGLLSASLSWHGCSRQPSDPVQAGRAAAAAPSARREDERDIAEIGWIGGSVERDESDPDRPVLTVLLHGPRVSDEALAHVARFVKLPRLSRLDSAISDAGLVHLRGLAQLQFLYLSGTDVTDRGRRPRLRKLDLRGPGLGDAGKRSLPDLARRGVPRSLHFGAAHHRMATRYHSAFRA